MALRYRRTQEVIESTPSPAIEHAFIKYPGREAVDVTDYKMSTEWKCEMDWEAVERLYKGPYKHIHTHPSSFSPTFEDMQALIEHKEMKTMVIAVREPESGKVLGRHIFKKRRRMQNESGNISQKEAENYLRLLIRSHFDKKSQHDARAFERRFNLLRRVVPAKGYKVDAYQLAFRRV